VAGDAEKTGRYPYSKGWAFKKKSSVTQKIDERLATDGEIWKNVIT